MPCGVLEDDLEDLNGDGLAEAAQAAARRLDPDRQGLHHSVLLKAVRDEGHTIRGNDAVTLQSALNGAQHRFTRTGRGIWTWIETRSVDGLSAEALLDEAYLLAKRLDPGREGVHYGRLASDLEKSGVQIAGGNAGKTLFSVLKNSDQWFETLGEGRFRWR
jgi:hypothetical protein